MRQLLIIVFIAISSVSFSQTKLVDSIYYIHVDKLHSFDSLTFFMPSDLQVVKNIEDIKPDLVDRILLMSKDVQGDIWLLDSDKLLPIMAMRRQLKTDQISKNVFQTTMISNIPFYVCHIGFQARLQYYMFVYYEHKPL